VYDELERAHGVHLTSQVTLRTADQAQVMRRLRATPPDVFGAETVSGLTDLAAGAGGGGGAGSDAGAGNGAVPRADVLIFRLAGGRVVLRPSGTEPKIKCYIEITEPVAGRSLAQARAAAAGRLAPLRDALGALLAAA
jgi:phosphomannomutase